MSVDSEQIAWEGGTISAVWDHADRAGAVLVLGHGAGGTLHTAHLARFAAAVAARGITAVRFNFPYAEARRRVPDRQPILEACYRAAASHIAERSARGVDLFLGGRSMGGRIASHLVADGHPARGLVFVSYPLHPPREPERLRAVHLERITIPMLFLQGTRDAFARSDLLARTLDRLPTATLHLIEGGDHGLTVRGREAAAVIAEVADVAARWVGDITGLG
ncbi:MAG TPA: alpha/beta family hydrolase [bacterium]|nr:alpha/beta family hydrolase [bacterium]